MVGFDHSKLHILINKYFVCQYTTRGIGARTIVSIEDDNTSFVYAPAVFPTYVMDSMDVFSSTGTRLLNYIVDTIKHCFVKQDLLSCRLAEEGRVTAP